MTTIYTYDQLYKCLKQITEDVSYTTSPGKFGMAFFWYINGDFFIIKAERKKYSYDLSFLTESEATYIIDKAITFLRSKISEHLAKSSSISQSNYQRPP